jgi:hypothetical protein
MRAAIPSTLLSGHEPHIEEAFSKVKGILRKVGARRREVLVEATGHALDAITPEDIRGFYGDCGYHPSLQSL